MAKRKAQSPFIGNWRIISMTEWDEDYLNMDVEAYLDLEANQRGTFQFGLVSGNINYRITERGGKPAIEFSWEGMDEMDECSGRGWAVLEEDELNGMFFFHQGDESGFVAKKRIQ